MSLNKIVLSATFVFTLIVVNFRLVQLIMDGGSPHLQGDWLINFGGGLVRRGGFGEIVFLLSEITGFHPVAIIGTVQSVLSSLVIIVLGFAVFFVGAPDRLVFVALSPVVVLMWLNDPLAAFRKEILAFAAFLPLFYPSRGRAYLAAMVSVLMFFVACMAHEGNSFVAPGLAWAVFLSLYSRTSRKIALRFLIAVLVIGIAGIVFALIFPSVPNTAQVCDAIVRHGGSDAICNGIVHWLDEGLGANSAAVAETRSGRSSLHFLSIVALFAFPFVLCIGGEIRKTPSLAVAPLLIGIPFLPLFAVGADWGRWVSMMFFTFALILTVHALRNRPAWIMEPLSKSSYSIAAVTSFAVGMNHLGFHIPGTAHSFLRIAGNWLP